MRYLLIFILLLPASVYADNTTVIDNATQTITNKEIYYPMQAEPTMPSAGESITWISNGTGLGDQGDVMMIVNIGGTVKYAEMMKWGSGIASLPVYKEIPYVQWVDGTFLQMIDGTYLEWVTAP